MRNVIAEHLHRFDVADPHVVEISTTANGQLANRILVRFQFDRLVSNEDVRDVLIRHANSLASCPAGS